MTTMSAAVPATSPTGFVLPPSPPASIARSSSGTGPSSTAPGEPRPQPSAQFLEDQLFKHFRVLKRFLASSQRVDPLYQPHNRARDKLLRLSPIQFQELSTDVFDELLRREDEERYAAGMISGPGIPKYLLPKNNFHPKRNQARQKLSTLAVKKFRELATDVLFELERRNPSFLTRPMPPPPRPEAHRTTSREMPRSRSTRSRAPSNSPSVYTNSPMPPYSPTSPPWSGRW
ncbi:hypothetical protein MRB53_040869 [Persea americana]|nr:hypothetical protein MRB53_040869 [Persea americana]